MDVPCMLERHSPCLPRNAEILPRHIPHAVSQEMRSSIADAPDIHDQELSMGRGCHVCKLWSHRLHHPRLASLNCGPLCGGSGAASTLLHPTIQSAVANWSIQRSAAYSAALSLDAPVTV